MSLNEVRCLPQCGSTNLYAKEHIEEFGPVGAVYTTCQTDGRGRLGRRWVNAAGQALYYTAVLKVPMVQPGTLPLLASLAVRKQLALRYGVECAIKWPNDLLLGGKKVVGILCEAVSYGTNDQGRGYLCGIGINLAQPQSYFDQAELPYGTSLLLQGARVDLETDPSWLAEGLTDCLRQPGPAGLLQPGWARRHRHRHRHRLRGPAHRPHRQRGGAGLYRGGIHPRHLWPSVSFWKYDL